MEGVIDALTRDLLTRQAGFDWTVTEFVRVVDTRLPPRVFYKHCPELTGRPVATPSGVPVHLQLLGSDPRTLAENARQALALGAISVDLNFGCPAKLVNRHDGGASLLRQPDRVYQAVKAVAEALDGAIPVTAKIRLGFANRRLAVACAQATEAGGAARLVVHGRTRDEGYRPPAHWEWIGKVRHHVSIPVVANGDIWTLEDYWKARTLSGCCDVMLGRIELPSAAEMAADSAAWLEREEALGTAYEEIDFQGDYTQDLVDATDYPDFDIPEVNRMFKQWKDDKKADIMNYRDKGFRSTLTGTMAPVHHTPWMEAMDDSMETYLLDEAPEGGG